MKYEFFFSGGMTKTPEWGSPQPSISFLCLPLVPRGAKYTEMFLSEATKLALVDKVVYDRMQVPSLPEWYPDHRITCYRTNLPYVKVFAGRGQLGRGKQYLSFYMKLGRHNPRKTVTLRPFAGDPKTYIFHAEGTVLTKKEALALLEPSSVGYAILSKQSYTQYPKTVLRTMVQLHTETQTILPTARRILRAPPRQEGTK